MYLYYHQDPLRNFGDDLNPWLWERIFPGRFQGYVAHDPSSRSAIPADAVLFVGIGTLLNQNIPSTGKKVVFGSGTGYGELPKVDESWDIRFVRGPLTAARLKIEPNRAIIDPAILAAGFIAPSTRSKSRISYMPHCASARQTDWQSICDAANLEYIDPQWSVDKVLAAIQDSPALLSEALHGAILAEALRVPWMPIRSTPALLDLKWNDWCLSIDRVYEPYSLTPIWRPSGGITSRVKTHLKRVAVVNQLKVLGKRNRTSLAKDKTIELARLRLCEEIEHFDT